MLAPLRSLSKTEAYMSLWSMYGRALNETPSVEIARASRIRSVALITASPLPSMTNSLRRLVHQMIPPQRLRLSVKRTCWVSRLTGPPGR